MDTAWAAVIVEENYCAILSEAAGSFNRAFLVEWVAKHKEGFFLRDYNSPLDCYLITPDKFSKLYRFERGDADAMFRRVVAEG